MDTTRPSLLIRIRDPKDGEAWTKFYELYGPLLYRYARSRGLSHEDAEDVRSTCYEAIVKQIASFEYDKARGGFKAWLRTLVNRRVVDRLRKKAARPIVAEALNNLPSTSPTAEELWEEQWQIQHLRYCTEAARQHVSTQTFEAFQLLAHDGLSVPDVCERLAINANQVYKAKARVLEAIRLQMALIFPEELDN